MERREAGFTVIIWGVASHKGGGIVMERAGEGEGVDSSRKHEISFDILLFQEFHDLIRYLGTPYHAHHQLYPILGYEIFTL